jgi:hypothetical protein
MNLDNAGAQHIKISNAPARHLRRCRARRVVDAYMAAQTLRSVLKNFSPKVPLTLLVE